MKKGKKLAQGCVGEGVLGFFLCFGLIVLQSCLGTSGQDWGSAYLDMLVVLGRK